ncbi:MAG: glycosyltransferase family 39 protein [Aeromicrobium sp.]
MTTPRAVALVVLAAVLVRIPFLTVLPSPDEAGLLLVGQQWGPGDSLYGDHWVDRPPLLIGVAAMAAHLGGVVALRVIGLVAVVVTVVACAASAGRLAGDRAARWAAVAAAILTVSPWLGADRVNAELLAAPWTAVGLLAMISAAKEPAGRWPAIAGAAAAAALMTKQNQADVAVFALVLLLASVLGGRLRTGEAWRVAVGGLLGALTLTALVVLAAWARGTDPLALADALYAFRLRADEVLALDPGSGESDRRSELLVRCAVAGQLVLAVAVVVAPLVRRFRSPAAWALSATVLFGCASIVAGGSWWNHYLVELSVPVAVGTGLIAARTRIAVPVVLAYATAAALVGTVILRPVVDAVDGPVAAGRMIGAAAAPGDSVVNAWGRPDLVFESGLDSPYEHLWSLPVRTDDAHLATFGALVAGEEAPTWLVFAGRSVASWGLEAGGARRVVDRRYRKAGSVCGYQIWLLRGIERSVPAPPRDVQCDPAFHLR